LRYDVTRSGVPGCMTRHEESHAGIPDTLVGRVIAGNFRLDRLIGSGATGNVYQAEQLSLGKAVAVKILHPQLMADDKLVRRFQREAKSASRLNHPNSVQIIESGQDPSGTLFIAMELLSGRDLAEVIREEFPLPVPRIVHIMSQVFSALDEAHAQGIIHRDLKPSNIMLIERRDEPDFVKVCDYGIAKAANDDSGLGSETQMLTVQGLVCGTPEYMSPEQARGEGLDGRTDLYSAAVILYQMTTGDVPFRAATPIGIVSRHLSEAPATPSSRRADAQVPPELDDLILRGLAKSRDLRPATAAIFREELERLALEGRPLGRRNRQSLADAMTLPATDPTSPASASTLEVVNQRQPSGRGGLAVPILLGVAVIGALAVVGVRRGAVPLPPASVPARPSEAPVTVAPAAVIPSPNVAAASAPIEAPRGRGTPAAPAAFGTSGASHDGAEGEATNTAAARDRAVHRRLIASAKAGHAAAASVTNRGATPSASKSEAVDSTPAAPPRAEPSKPVVAAGTDLPRAGGDEKPAPPPGGAGPSTPPQARGPKEMVAEGEKLLAQGEVAEACRRGEDAKHAAGKVPSIYKFLGKCYMRAGNATLAKDNYRHYLELAPNAPDAMFIESIVKESAK